MTDFPSLQFDQEAHATRAVSDESIARAADAFQQAGCLLIQDLLDVAVVDAMRDAFLERYPSYLQDRKHHDALEVGHRRAMVTVTLEPPFSAPDVYAHPLLLPILARLLDEVRLFSFGCVVALPGSEEQHVHRDGPGLFDRPELDGALPSYAVSVLIPLVDLDEETGTTRVWPGSHRDFGLGSEPFVAMDPQIRRGSVLLMDYRIFHSGTPNVSPSPRPILYNVYARPWFADPRNYWRQVPLIADPLTLDNVSADHRSLFAHHVAQPPREAPTTAAPRAHS